MVEHPVFTFRNFVSPVREKENERTGTGITFLRAHISRMAVSVEIVVGKLHYFWTL